MNILLVDDDSVDRELVRRHLCQSLPDAALSEAHDVSSGLQALKQHNFDIVLLDFVMPGRDGIELLMELQSERVSQSPAVVMISNAEDEDTVSRCIKAGAQDFLLKSEIEPRRLKRAVLNAQVRYDLENRLFETYQKTKQLAESDMLTGLANRYYFDQSLKSLIRQCQRGHCKLAILLIDLDHFKLINDSFGHESGDAVLGQIADRLRQSTRDSELLARLGGDEFALVLKDSVGVEQSVHVAERILQRLQEPYELAAQQQLTTGGSIGIAIYPDNGENAEELLRCADIAMYRAKKQGRNQYCFYQKEMQALFTERLQIESGLRSSLDSDDFVLHFQPIQQRQTDELWGFEALLRWYHSGQLQSPAVFMPIAEETNLIRPIGKQVIQQAISTLAQWQSQVDKPLHVAINLSPVQLDDNTLVPFIERCLHQFGLQGRHIEFEITETMLVDYSDQVVDKIRYLKELGCSIALDDFGTGFSSITHLQRFPIDVVKIDRSLMPVDEHDETNVRLSRGLASMIHSLGLASVAEGVETVEQLQFCGNIQATRVQGYYLAKPMTAEDAVKWFLQ